MMIFFHKPKKLYYLFFFSLLLISCEGFVGLNGIVVDMESGERLSNVTVELETPNVSNIKDTTDLNGYFHTSTLVGCVFGGCDEYELYFTKKGYKKTKIDEMYSRSPKAKYLNESDTLIVEMTKTK